MKYLIILLLLISCQRNTELDEDIESLNRSIFSLELSAKKLECAAEVQSKIKEIVRKYEIKDEELFYYVYDVVIEECVRNKKKLEND